MRQVLLFIKLVAFLAVIPITGVPVGAEDTKYHSGEGALVVTAWRADGQVVAAATREELRIYTNSMELITQLSIESGYRFTDLAWHPSENRLAAATLTSTPHTLIYIWSITGVPSNISVEVDRIMDVPPIGLAGMSWSQDTRLAISFASSEIHVWDTNTGNLMETIRPDGNVSVDGIAWSPDNLRLAASIAPDHVDMFDMSTYQKVGSVESQDPDLAHYPYAIAWSPSSERFAVSEGSTIYIWQYNTVTDDYQLITSLPQSPGVVLALDWQSDRLAGSAEDNTIRVWETDTWDIITCIPNGGDLRSAFGFSLSPDGSQLAYSGDGGALEIMPVPGSGSSIPAAPTVPPLKTVSE